MRVRTLLAATAASMLLVAGLTSTAVRADLPIASGAAGSLVSWGDTEDPSAGPAIPVPGDISDLAVDVAVSDRATATVTLDGRLRVWGANGAGEVAQAPTDVTDAISVVLSNGNGAVLRDSNGVTAWGASADLAHDAPQSGVTAISLAAGTGYAIYLNSLMTWGDDPGFVLPTTPIGATLADVSAGPAQVLVLDGWGNVHAAGDAAIPAFNTVPSFGVRKVTQIATGPGANGVVLDDGTIRIWGPSTPPGQPDLTGKKVVSLDLGANAVAVTEDGSVYTWGAEASLNAIPASLAGQPVAQVAMGAKHAAAIVSYRMMANVGITGTPQVGQTLTVTPARYSWTPTTAAGQWYVATRPLKGQTGPTLIIDDSLAGALITYQYTATRGSRTLRTESDPVGPVTRAPSATTLAVSPARGAAGKTRIATATVTRPGGTPTGTVTFTVGDHSRVVQLQRGKATWTLPRLVAGSHSVTATYSGSPSADPSAAAPAALTVTKAASKLRATARATAKRVRIAVKVRTDKTVSAAGRVIVKVAGRKARAEVDANGRAVLTVKRVPRGTHVARVTYAGNGSVAGSKGSVRVRS